MKAGGVVSPEGASGGIFAPRQPKGWLPDPGRTELLARLRELDSSLRFLDGRSQASEEDSRFLEHLRERLEGVKTWLENHPKRRRLLFEDFPGEMLDEVQADMLLLMPVDMLASEALAVEELFRLNIQEPIVRAAWLGPDGRSGPLCQAVHHVTRLASRASAVTQEELLGLRHARRVLRNMLRLVNEQTQLHQRQLAFTLLVRSASGVMLLLSFILSWLCELPMQFAKLLETDAPLSQGLGFLALALSGAGGAIAANLLSETPTLLARSPSLPQLVYSLFIKPSMGAFAAFLFFLLAQSHLLFTIESAEQMTGGEGSPFQPAIRILVGGSPQALACTYGLICIAVGFSAEKVLGPLMDKVLGKLLTQAERTQASPSPLPEARLPVPPSDAASRV
jgi:hypothetical protein